LQWADVIVCGPGLGKGDAARLLVHMVLKNADVPVILDADALNIIAEETEILQRPHTELILTPHLGEMARLLGATISYIKDHLMETAQEFARTYNLILVQKDARTITSIPYGMTYVNLSGNNGMATGGSGDVLTGVIAGLVAQGAAPALAAPLGVYIHGLAGDAGAKHMGSYSLTASTLLEALPQVFQRADIFLRSEAENQ
jgi:NAD(P)H-hydrate epimerase